MITAMLARRRRLAAVFLVLLVVAAPRSSGAELGRLFFTPQPRQDLDRRRQANIREVAAVVTEKLTVDGRVARSSGKSTTWINGVPQNDTYAGRDAGRVAVSPGEGEASVPLKVGETWDKASGTVSDGLGGGKVKVDSRRQGSR